MTTEQQAAFLARLDEIDKAACTEMAQEGRSHIYNLFLGLHLAATVIRQQQTELTDLRRAVVDMMSTLYKYLGQGAENIPEIMRHVATITRAQEALK